MASISVPQPTSKTIFQNLEALKNTVQDKEGQKIPKELEQNFHLLKSKEGISQLLGKKRLQKRCEMLHTKES